jgi:hypothetical protein
MRRGGAKWKQGADTCVFKPAVKCTEGTPSLDGMISRIQSDSTANEEKAVEEVLKASFPKLIENGSITVSSHVCTPVFEEGDLESSEEVAGANIYKALRGETTACQSITKSSTDLTNFITPERGVPYADLPPPASLKERYSYLRPLLLTAISLVPDTGPWVIHTDCHTRNILVHEGNPTIIDWGRALVIRNPDNETETRRIVNDWFKKPYAKITPQYPRSVQQGLLANDYSTVKNTLRGWVPRILCEQMLGGAWEWNVFTTQQEMLDFVKSLDKEYSYTGGMYWPTKYFRGLTRKQNLQRKRSATRRTKMSFKNPKAYVPWKSDKGVKTRRSSYTSKFHAKYSDAKTLPEIAKATGISKSILQEVYDRGMAAWRTGHRPGASQHAWGMARVHSFVMKGKTWRTADSDLARKV